MQKSKYFFQSVKNSDVRFNQNVLASIVSSPIGKQMEDYIQLKISSSVFFSDFPTDWSAKLLQVTVDD